MKVRVSYHTPDMQVDETFSGDTPEAVVAAMQRTIAARLNFALRLLVNAMSPAQFAQEVVARYNEATRRSIPRPQSCAEFLRLAEAEGVVKILDS